MPLRSSCALPAAGRRRSSPRTYPLAWLQISPGTEASPTSESLSDPTPCVRASAHVMLLEQCWRRLGSNESHQTTPTRSFSPCSAGAAQPLTCCLARRARPVRRLVASWRPGAGGNSSVSVSTRRRGLRANRRLQRCPSRRPGFGRMICVVVDQLLCKQRQACCFNAAVLPPLFPCFFFLFFPDGGFGSVCFSCWVELVSAHDPRTDLWDILCSWDPMSPLSS